jgi:hypothetical protein
MLDASYSPRVALVPEGGARNPVFARVDGADVLHATFLFDPPLADAELDAASRAMKAWFAARAGAELVDESLTPSALHVAVRAVTDGQLALASLQVGIADAAPSLRRAVYTRAPADRDRDALVLAMDPAARAQVRYEEPAAWLRACFDAGAPPPLSEDVAALESDENALLEVARTTFAERRGMPLHVAGLRVCHGLAELAFTPADARTRDVARVFRAALRARFDGEDAPYPYSSASNQGRDGAIDRIVAGPVDGTRDQDAESGVETLRVGYACAFRATELREFLHDHYFRYREHELMLAARDAALALDLEPVVCWRRFRGRYVVQLWERAAGRTSAAA